MMAASPNRCYSGHHKATEEEGDQGILGKEIWRKKCGQQDACIVQLEEDGGSSTRQSWVETSGLWLSDYCFWAPYKYSATATTTTTKTGTVSR